MIAATGEYLINIIERRVNQTIGLRRNLCAEEIAAKDFFNATNEELADFILSIPYFDERLKNFMLGFLTEQTIIISQSWEIAFIVRTGRWAESNEWLHGAFQLSMSSVTDHPHHNPDFLTLPY
jgi:hypothetical protein